MQGFEATHLRKDVVGKLLGFHWMGFERHGVGLGICVLLLRDMGLKLLVVTYVF